MTDRVTTRLEGHVAVIEMNSPPANFVDPTSLARIVDAMDDAVSDQGARAIVLYGSGRHFCAGVDFGAEGLGKDRASGAREFYGHAARIFEIEVPIVAAIKGAAVGGGLGLACAADFRVVASNARLHANFATLGFHPGFALSATLPGIVGVQKSAELMYTARRIDGNTAFELGLADRVVPEEEVRTGAVAFAGEIAAQAPLAIRSMKATFRSELRARIKPTLARELSEQAMLWETDDSRIGIAASVARETPTFQGR